MGTNYYARMGECKCCGRYEDLHLGKSSGGWCFTLHVYQEENIHSLDDLMEYIGESPIYNEYDEEVSQKEFIGVVTERRGVDPTTEKYFIQNPFDSLPDFLSRNNAELGPNNLLRHKIGFFCVGHGPGTYDYCVGGFS